MRKSVAALTGHPDPLGPGYLTPAH